MHAAPLEGVGAGGSDTSRSAAPAYHTIAAQYNTLLVKSSRSGWFLRVMLCAASYCGHLAPNKGVKYLL